MSGQRFKFSIAMLAIAMAVSFPAQAAEDSAIAVAKGASESINNDLEQREILVDKTAKRVADVRAALTAYYSDKLAWPSSLDALVEAGYYPSKDFSTPFGVISGKPSGMNYELDMVLPDGKRANAIGRLIAAKANGKASGANNTNLTFSLGTPSQANLVKNMLSRVADPANPAANTMQTALNMGSHNILNVGTIDAQILNGASANITGSTTTGTMAVSDWLSVGGDSTFNGNVFAQKAVTIAGPLTVNSATILNGDLAVAGKATMADVDMNNLLVKGNQVTNGTATFNGATTINNTLTVTGKSTLADTDVNNLLVKGNQVTNGTATFNGATVVNNTFSVAGKSTLADVDMNNLLVKGNQETAGNLIVDGTATLKGPTLVQNKLTVTGGAKITGLSEFDSLQVNQNGQVGGNFTVAGTTNLKETNIDGAAVINGSLNAGATQLGSLKVLGTTTMNGDLIGTNATFSGNVTANAVKAKTLGYYDGSWKDVATEINALKAKNATQDSRLDALEAWKSTMSTWKVGVDSDIASLKNRTSSLENRMTNVENRTSSLESRMNNAETNIANLGGTIANVSNSVNGLQNSGNGKWSTYWTGQTTGSVAIPSDALMVAATYYVDYTFNWANVGYMLDDYYFGVVTKPGVAAVGSSKSASSSACSNTGTTNSIPAITVGFTPTAAYGNPLINSVQMGSNGACGSATVTIYLVKIEIMK